MTTVEINRSGTDQTTLDIFQTGSYESSVALRHDLLDSKLNYHFAVTSLSVPLNEAPIFRLTEAKELFRIERRDTGNTKNADLTLHTPGNAGAVVPYRRRVFTINPKKKFFDVSSFVKDLSNFCRGFNMWWTMDTEGNGFNPQAGGYSGVGGPLPGRTAAQWGQHGSYLFLTVKLTADGTLQLVGNDYFWNNFVLRFTRLGGAVLGFYDQLQAVNIVAAGAVRELHTVNGVETPDTPYAVGTQTEHYYIAKSLIGGNLDARWLDPVTGQIELANMVQESVISSDHPIFQSVDQRIKLTVETHMPIASSISVEDEVEKIDRSICDVYFESRLQNQIKFGESGDFDSMVMSSAMWAGQANLVKKSDINFQWNKLSTAAYLKLFRFQLYIWYRVWNDSRREWTLSRGKLDVPAKQFWELSVRFVSDS